MFGNNFKLIQLSSAILFCGLFLIACHAPARSGGGHEQRYDLKGKVVSVDKEHGKVLVAHEEIPGFMDAMEMSFPLKDKHAFEVIAAGDYVQATLVVSDERYWLENPVITKGGAEMTAAEGAGGAAVPEEGASVPDFSLLNQDGGRISLRKYQGKALVVTFIYTRCPLPEYCTLMSTNFAELNRALRDDPTLRPKAHLLSVSIDSAYDKPKVLRSYGAAHTGEYSGEKFETWEFATGDAEEVKRLAQFFGLSYHPEKDEIIHSLRTAVVSPEGKVYKIYRGNEWKPSEILSDLKELTGER